MRGLPATVSWNIDFYLRAAPAAIYSSESSCMSG